MIDNEMNGEKSFEELLNASSEAGGRKLFPGDEVSGKVLKVSKDTIFVDLGGKSEGIADIQEFMDKAGKIAVQQGDWVEMRVASIRDGIRLTKGMKVQGPDALDILREAKENIIPIEGRVSGVVKEASRSTSPVFVRSVRWVSSTSSSVKNLKTTSVRDIRFALSKSRREERILLFPDVCSLKRNRRKNPRRP
ncbi:MAG: S1 RNA-binding domain-containing protein [Thermodesulfobacteriota bacterium]